MRLFVIITTLCLFELCAPREITSQTLDRLEGLIKSFKESLTEDQKPSTQTEIPPNKSITNSNNAKKCGRTVRMTYQRCVSLAKTEDGQTNCVNALSKAYPKCYFGQRLNKGDKNLFQCEQTCLRNYDECSFDSSRAEIFVCVHGRKLCQKSCPWPKTSSLDGNYDVAQKRSSQACHNHCEGTFDQCMYNGRGIENNLAVVLLCNGGRAKCRNEECG